MKHVLALLCLAPALCAALNGASVPALRGRSKDATAAQVAHLANLNMTLADANLWAWMRYHGAIGIDGMRIEQFDKGGYKVRGLAATRAFKKGETIMRIPANLVMHAGDKNGDLELMLLDEKRKGRSSFWYPYIETLPTKEDFASFYPTYMDSSLLEEFRDIPVAAATLTRQQQVSLMLASIKMANTTKPSDHETISLEQFRWADAVMSSRAYGSEEFSSVLKPLADLANTAVSSNMLWARNLQDGYYVFKAATNIKAGEELTESYQISSPKDNSAFLENYGFVLAGNPTKVIPAPQSWSGCQEKRLSAPMAGSRNFPSAFRKNLDMVRREYCGQ